MIDASVALVIAAIRTPARVVATLHRPERYYPRRRICSNQIAVIQRVCYRRRLTARLFCRRKLLYRAISAVDHRVGVFRSCAVAHVNIAKEPV
jgi:hypothetical protein